MYVDALRLAPLSLVQAVAPSGVASDKSMPSLAAAASMVPLPVRTA